MNINYLKGHYGHIYLTILQFTWIAIYYGKAKGEKFISWKVYIQIWKGHNMPSYFNRIYIVYDILRQPTSRDLHYVFKMCFFRSFLFLGEKTKSFTKYQTTLRYIPKFILGSCMQLNVQVFSYTMRDNDKSRKLIDSISITNMTFQFTERQNGPKIWHWIEQDW